MTNWQLHHGQRRRRLGAHHETIACGIQQGDPTNEIRIVHWAGKKIGRHGHAVVMCSDYCGVVWMLQSDNDIVMRWNLEII